MSFWKRCLKTMWKYFRKNSLKLNHEQNEIQSVNHFYKDFVFVFIKNIAQQKEKLEILEFIKEAICLDIENETMKNVNRQNKMYDCIHENRMACLKYIQVYEKKNC